MINTTSGRSKSLLYITINIDSRHGPITLCPSHYYIVCFPHSKFAIN